MHMYMYVCKSKSVRVVLEVAVLVTLIVAEPVVEVISNNIVVGLAVVSRN